MPDPALPEPRPSSPRPTVGVRIRLAQPLSGVVTLTPRDRVNNSGPITAHLTAGALNVRIEPGTYRFSVDLQTDDGAPVAYAGTITVS